MGSTLCHCIPPFSKGTTWAHDQCPPFTLCSNPCPATHHWRLCQFSITQPKSPLKWAKYNSSFFPWDSQVKLVQQQISRVKAQETQDCMATSRGGQGNIPFFGGKEGNFMLLHHPGHSWNACSEANISKSFTLWNCFVYFVFIYLLIFTFIPIGNSEKRTHFNDLVIRLGTCSAVQGGGNRKRKNEKKDKHLHKFFLRPASDSVPVQSRDANFKNHQFQVQPVYQCAVFDSF